MTSTVSTGGKDYVIVSPDSPLHPANEGFLVRVGNLLYNGDQLHKMIGARQCGQNEIYWSVSGSPYSVTREHLLSDVFECPTAKLPMVPRQWVENRTAVRRSIFDAANHQLASFRSELALTSPASKFLFAQCGTGEWYDICWTTGKSLFDLILDMDDVSGRNELGTQLSSVRLGAIEPVIDLYNWLFNDNCSKPGPPYGFLVIGASSLKYLEVLESALLVVQEGLLFRDVSQYLTRAVPSKFKYLVVQVGIEDRNMNFAEMRTACKKIYNLDRLRCDSVYISAPVPSLSWDDEHYRDFKVNLRAAATQHGFRFIDGDSLDSNPFRNPVTTIERSYYEDGCHLNVQGTWQLLTIYSYAMPSMAQHRVRYRDAPYQQKPFRIAPMPLFRGPNCVYVSRAFFSRKGSVHDGWFRSPMYRLMHT